MGDDIATYNARSIIHGTQVLETIVAVAPEVDLYACEYDTFDSFSLCIDWMIASGVNIINHSAGVPALPLNGSSRWSMQVDRAAQANILWVNSAGNFAQGYYTDVITDNNLNSLHEFRGNAGIVEALGIAPIENDATGVVMLSWLDNNGVPANEIDIDLQVIDAQSGEIIASSYNAKSGLPDEQALEYLAFEMDIPFAVQIIDRDGTASGVRFALFVEFATLPSGEAQRSIIAPGDSLNSLTVGSLQGVNLAPYSSRGPLATGAIKPDLVAPSEIQFLDGSQFVGTSAAAPVVAGSAALIWQANPEFTANNVRVFLLNATQDDDQILGNDINFGNGRLFMPLPLSTAVVQPTTSAQSELASSSSTEISSTPAPIVTENPTPTMQVSYTETLMVTVEVANLRAGPGTNYNQLGAVTGGTELSIVARTSDSQWYLVEQANGTQGWIWSGIVSVNGASSQIEIVATVPPTPTVIASSVSTDNFGAPSLISPANGQTFDFFPRTLRLEWARVSGAISYEVYVENCFVANVGDTATDNCVYYLSETVNTTTYTFNFVGGQPGRWLVRAIAQDGTPSAWSETRVFYFSR